jgi:quinoprotein glucose dehydrogenase
LHKLNNQLAAFATERAPDEMNAIKKIIFHILLLVLPVSARSADYELFAHTNMVPWCIVPYDVKQRGPEARAQMLERLGFKKLAYDWRAKDVPTFDAEVAAMKRHGIDIIAWWFPGGLNSDARAILDCIQRNHIHPQLWVALEGGAHLRLNQAFERTPAAQAAHIARLVAQVKPIAAEAAKLGCEVALYNHGGWDGVPENQIEIIKRLKEDGVDNVGMVYTQHHGYGEIDRFAEVFPKMQPYLLALSLHGMTRNGDLQNNSLREAPLGQGEEDLRLLRIIKDSGWKGPVALIGEVPDVDVELRLQDQLAGLDWLVSQLDGNPPGPRPVPRAWQKPAAGRVIGAPVGEASVSADFGQALRGSMQVAGRPEFRERPLTVECWAKLDSATAYNILVASDTKASAEHWELYSAAGSGTFCVFQPGRGGDFVSAANICDGKWHYLAAIIEPGRVRLLVDGKVVKDAPATPLQGEPVPGDLTIGNLVEGGMGCDGLVDNVRISRGVRQISSVPAGPLKKDSITLALWDFEELPATNSGIASAGNISVSPAFGKALRGTMQVAGRAEYRQRPLTVECWAKLDSATAYNILVASDTKASAEHWELYSAAGSGVFCVFQPGRGGDFTSAANICDGKWHYLAAIIETERVRLLVDGKVVTDAPATPLQGDPMPGDLMIGNLVEGGMGCDGLVDNVRISRGAREISSVPTAPLTRDAATVALWDFEEAPTAGGAIDYWAVESAAERAALPEFRTIPAALPSDLTPANGFPKRASFRNWYRSHGDNSGERFSALDQINRQNVTNLQVAWVYHSKDGAANIQCNPVMADGILYGPTAGGYIVGINASTGTELWRFKPQSQPAQRGLIYWPGDSTEKARLYFCSGNYLYALDPKTGKPIASFGENGRAILPGASVVAPGIFQHFIVVPGFQRDVFGLDLLTGKMLWTFHTIPHPGEFGYDTWDRTENYGANCWGGMAMDEQRGIAYISTGSHDMIGVWIRGDNLFGNCLIALDARTGKRLWHFQDIHHDIWDLDIAAPPNLTTITRNGKRVDVVDVVTKIGNTLLLDRLTGKPIFPYRERRAPTSTLPGEVTAPYQPDPELPQPIIHMEFKPGDLTDLSEESTASVQARFKSATMGFFQPNSEGKMNLYFGIHGGAEWTGACVDPDSGHLFVTANNIPWLISVFRDEDPPDDPNAPRTHGHDVFDMRCAVCHGKDRVGIGVAPPLRGLRFRMNDQAFADQVRKGKNGMPAQADISDTDLKALADFLMLRDRPMPPAPPKGERPRYSFNGYPKFLDYENYPASKPPWGTLNCLDLNSGKLLWKVPLGEYPELTQSGVPKTGTENFGGAIVTAGGLVFCAGTRDSRIRAFDKDTGAELWSAKLPWVGSAPPACYEVNGREFIVIPATGGGKLATPVGDAYVAFALPSVDP